MLRYSLSVLTLLGVFSLTWMVGAQAPKGAPKNAKAQAKQQQQPATPAEKLEVPPGFVVELLHTADPATEGSWINMTKDTKGRLIITGQQNQPILRVTVGPGGVEKTETLALPITGAMGLLCAFDSLYINGIGPKGFGLYRCTDTTNDDQYDKIEHLKTFNGNGEHGPHAIALGQDNQLYIINGNHTDPPADLAATSPFRNYREDILLPRQWDPSGHAVGKLAPAGYVTRTDAEGKKWELVLGGFRNAFDMAFNADGELFAWDSDMEYDWGSPWYRPIRVNHCTSGAEFGWRAGTGKWPSYYLDSLPAVADIGIGSPTGVTFGSGAKFPAKYQKAFYVLDWTYGRIVAVHMTPKGASYTSTIEPFVQPEGLKTNGKKFPLNVTDVVIHDDGAMYFTVGGRNTQAALYRVRYTGEESTAPAKLTNDTGAAERKLRHELEAFHGHVDAKAIAKAWPELKNADRFIRYAARIAIESQPVAEWQAKALAEKDPVAAFEALTALARYGDPKVLPELLTALEAFPMSGLTDDQKLMKMRTTSLAFMRMGRPGAAAMGRIVAELNALFPGKSEVINREAAQLLIYLQAPGIAAKTLKHMSAAATSEDQIHYLFHLRTLPIGQWTMDQRKEYLNYFLVDRSKLAHVPNIIGWFADVGRPYTNGASHANFFRNFFREAAMNMSDAERAELAPMIASIDKNAVPTYDVPPRKLVKEWQMGELEPMLTRVDKGRNFAKGRQAYFAGQCIKCHRFGEEGGAVGPELTVIANRFTRRDMLESILDPSKVISDQYENSVIETSAGKIVTGRVVDESADRVVIQPDPLSPQRIDIPKKEIESRTASKVSPMPSHLADVLTPEEILDLIAFMESGGRADYRAFR